MALPLTACSCEAQRLVRELEKLSLETIAHRKKFQLAVSQLRKFVDHFQSVATDTLATPEQMDAFHVIISVIREYNQLFGQYLLHCWAHSVLDNASSVVPAELCGLATRLQEAAQILDSEGARFLDARAPEWLQFHLIDLKAIAASLQKYVDGASPSDKVLPIMRNKLDSVNCFLGQYAQEDLTPDSRVFSPIPISYQSWRLDHGDFECEQEVGSGVSAIVYYGRDTRTGNEVAVKRLKFDKLSGSRLRAFQREVVILATAIHPTLLGFVGATDSPPFSIVTEWMGGGTLSHDLRKTHKLDATQLTICAFDIARGMQFLHSKQIIHRDLKTLNVLLSTDGRAKICDFGFSRKVKKDEILTQSVGTPHWMAPELLGGQTSYDEKIDVYSYAIVLWELMAKKTPYQGMESGQIVGQVLLNDLRPTIPDDTPHPWRELMEACWTRDPRQRPSFHEILKILETGRVLLPGADREAVMKYMAENKDADERAADAMESELESQGRMELTQFYSALVRDGIPPDLVERCWDNLQTFSKDNKTELYVKCIALFLKTTMNTKAARFLRSLPPGTVPREIASSACSLIPTGNELFDTDLVMLACKNSAAEEVVLHSIQSEHTKVALEVLAKVGLQDPKNKPEVVQRCLSCLQTLDSMTIVAAFRCLITLGATSQIPTNVMRTHMESRHVTVKMATYIAAAKMAQEGTAIPCDFLDAFVAKWEVMPLAGAVLVHACSHVECARHLMNRLMYGSLPPTALCVRLLAESARHPELRGAVKTVLGQMQIPETNPAISYAVSLLNAELKA